MNTDRFDVLAKAEGGTSQDQLPLITRTLLAERFKLALHRETKELPVYSLVVMKRGIKFSESKDGSCVAPGSHMTPPSSGQPQPSVCGTIVAGVNGLKATKIAMAQLANGLSTILGRSVIDKTGLTGQFDIHLEFSRDEATAGLMEVEGAGCGPATSTLSSTAPSIFTAVREQLGLEIKSSKGPVEVLVIDHAERPSEN